MIEVKCDRGVCEITLSGDIPELSADTITVVHAIYDCIFDKSTLAAMEFRHFVKEAIDLAFIINNDKEEEVNEQR